MPEIRVVSSCTCCPNEPSGFCEMPGCECPCCVMGYADVLSEDLVKGEARAARAESERDEARRLLSQYEEDQDRAAELEEVNRTLRAAVAALVEAGTLVASDQFWRTEDQQYELAVGIKGPLYEADHLNSCGGLQVFKQCTDLCNAVRALRVALADPAVRRAQGAGEGVTGE